MARIAKHLMEATASQGMKVYLHTCATATLPHLVTIAEEYAALDPPARMRRYLDTFGEHFEKSSKVVVTPASESLLARLGFAEDEIEVVKDDTPKATKSRRTLRRNRKTKTQPFGAGSKFTYNTSGVVWTIESVEGNVAICSNGKRTSTFKVSTLVKLAAKGIVS